MGNLPHAGVSVVLIIDPLSDLSCVDDGEDYHNK